MTPFLIIAVVATIAMLAWLGYLQEQKRRTALAAVASELGLSFTAGVDRDHDDEYSQFEIFRRGHARVARNTMRGEIELFGRRCALVCGDFRYRVTSGSGKHRSTRTYRFSYVIAHLPWRTPALLVRREGFFDKLKGALGFDDIDFESDEFSREFYVQSPDKRFAYDVLHPRMIELLLRERPPMIDIEGGAICVSNGDRRWQPSRFAAEIAFVQRFCELWPRHLTAELDR